MAESQATDDTRPATEISSMSLLDNTILTPHPATLASLIGFDCIYTPAHCQDKKLRFLKLLDHQLRQKSL